MKRPVAVGLALGSAGALMWTGWQALAGYGRLLLAQDELRNRVAALERQLSVQAPGAGASLAPSSARPAPGLTVGAAAPDFALPDLDGRARRLGEFRGQPTLVVFFNTGCGFCSQMAPRLGQLPAGSPRVVLIGSGDASVYRQLAAEHRWRCDVLLDNGGATLRAYQATGTPTGYLLDADGTVASPLTLGADALLALLTENATERGGSPDGPEDLTLAALRHKEQAAAERARAAGLQVRDSTLNRSGLSAGTPAPDFRLPDVRGVEHSLSDLKGERVLLVFSDPQCAPCQTLAPDLARLHREQRFGDPRVLMISRGDVDANRAKVDEHGLEFPVLLQPGWQVSKKYEIFATPVGYLIDEHGVISDDAAVGGDAILRLHPAYRSKSTP